MKIGAMNDPRRDPVTEIEWLGQHEVVGGGMTNLKSQIINRSSKRQVTHGSR